MKISYTGQQFIDSTRGYAEFCLDVARGNQAEHVKRYAEFRQICMRGDFHAEMKAMQDAAHYKHVVTSAVAGLKLAETIIAAGPEKLEAWAKARGENAPTAPRNGFVRRLPEHVDGDYGEFLKAFELWNADVPDNGSILAGLSTLVDRAAGIEDSSYCY